MTHAGARTVCGMAAAAVAVVIAAAACSAGPGGERIGEATSASTSSQCNVFATSASQEPSNVQAALAAAGEVLVGHVTLETAQGNYPVAVFAPADGGPNPLQGSYGFVASGYFANGIVCNTPTWVVPGSGNGGDGGSGSSPPATCTPPGTACPSMALSAGGLRTESCAVAVAADDDAGAGCVEICGGQSMCIDCCPNQ